MIGALLLVANIAFVSPQQGGQAIGVQPIEITTDAKNVDRVEFSVDGVLAGVARKPPYRIDFDFGTSTAPRAITAKVLANGFRDAESKTITTAALTAGESINVDLVEVPVRIRSSRAVTASDLRVRENDVEQTIRDVKPGRGPAHFMFIVDRSLSMGGGKLEAALQAVDGVQKLLRPGDSASVVLFNHNVSKPEPLPVPRDVMPSGGTSLRDAVASIASPDRTYAIVLTDGGDRNSELSDEQALERISGTKSIVAAVVFGRAGSFLERATRTTGGALVSATPRTAASELRSIIEDINSRYLVVYQSHGTKSGWRSIAIAARRRGTDILAARKGYLSR